ncbi:MAG: metallophosphoesterase [Bdellovibrionales bacterium]|nr:metallophosphoesterase [Bdellovibrionales bacterium]
MANSQLAEGRLCKGYLSDESNSRFQRLPKNDSFLQNQKFIRDHAIYIPVIGDVHGELDRFLFLISQLQVQYQVKFPIIFQLGDLGINQDPDRYPRWHPKNANQINEFSQGNRLISNKYFGTLAELNWIEADIFVVRGNHDFYLEQFLHSSRASRFAEHFYMIPDGVVQEVELIPGERIIVGARGGINQTAQFGRNEGKRMSRLLRSRLKPLHNPLNSSNRETSILLTHQGPTFEIEGSPWINELITEMKPRIHLHGHSHIALNKTTQLGDTQTIAVGHLPPEGELCVTAPFVSMLRYDLKTKEVRIE